MKKFGIIMIVIGLLGLMAGCGSKYPKPMVLEGGNIYFGEITEIQEDCDVVISKGVIELITESGIRYENPDNYEVVDIKDKYIVMPEIIDEANITVLHQDPAITETYLEDKYMVIEAGVIIEDNLESMGISLETLNTYHEKKEVMLYADFHETKELDEIWSEYTSRFENNKILSVEEVYRHRDDSFSNYIANEITLDNGEIYYEICLTHGRDENMTKRIGIIGKKSDGALTKDELSELTIEWENAANKGDTTLLVYEHYTEEATYFGRDFMHGREALYNQFRRSVDLPGYSIDLITSDYLSINETTAVEFGEYDANGYLGTYMLLWKNVDGKWMVALDAEI